jgi:multiple sugar transport system permease protein
MDSTRNKSVGLIYIAPALLFVAAFTLYPLGQLFWVSLHSWSLLGGSRFIGFGNYVHAYQDPIFWSALFFTFEYTLYLTPILMILGYLFALLTSGTSRLVKLTRGIIFIPVVIGLGTSSLLWVWLFQPQIGLFNRLLVDLHILPKPLVWFGADATLGLWGVIISITWKVVGFGMILFVAGIQSIPVEVIEGAKIDGASYWQRVGKIIIPLSYRIILLVTLVSAIGSMLAFEQFYIMTTGAPENQTITSVYWIYTNSFTYFKLGHGATLSIMLMIIIVTGTAVQIAMTRRRGLE